MHRRSQTTLLTPFCELETSNALELRIFRRELALKEVLAARAQLGGLIASGWLLRQLMPEDTFLLATEMSSRHSASLGARTLDILHVASAVLLEADHFLSFDDRQLRLARAEGLKVL